MGENQNPALIKIERAEEGPSTTTRPVTPSQSPSSSSGNTLKVSDLSDGKKNAFDMALDGKSATISNLERQLALERNKY